MTGIQSAAQYSQETQYSQYSQYYQMVTGPAPSTHISAPQQFAIAGNVPTSVCFGSQGQAVPYSQLQSSPAYAASNSLWIQGTTSWTQYAVVPQGAAVPLLAISSSGGNGYLSEVSPSGQTYSYNYFFYPYSHLSFYADSIGRHILSFVINGVVSNTVIIDVTGNYVPPSNYMPPSYYPGYNGGYYPDYYYNYFPGYFGYRSFGGTVEEHRTSSEENGESKEKSSDENNKKGGDEDKGKNKNDSDGNSDENKVKNMNESRKD